MDDIEWPFRASEQLNAGALTFRELRRFHRAVFPGVWIPRGAELDAIGRARAAWLWSRRAGVLCSLSAAAVQGAKWIDSDVPAELIHRNRRPPPGIVVRSEVLADGETQQVGGLTVTAPARTAFDLGRLLPETEAVQRVDALMNATDLKAIDVERVAECHPGSRGLHRLRRTLQLVDGGAESPYESLTRLVLVRSGFPQPQTQVKVRDEFGRVFARLDMGWSRWKVAVEYDGKQHWADSRQRAWDIDRMAMLEAAGWVVIRVSADLLRRQGVIIERVAVALAGRGWVLTR
ncbi:hypothetical protein NGTWS0302_00190 [Mycolicibacterium cyprinidarum]|uniref:DUF559 domain-containing protein n=1 Tax=Mycolicibacterium cyprinidarum TaxID=2860311 RepID=A0ABQ4VBZ7_9MYCO|nr:hypothetical protein NGTWS0302_00190 [Mycolicibacterium sp. NGTWS0302]GJF16204.1 hypothetical protein NGTWS1702_20730 [Mycolicibacterium sp. NGTWSNA01]GJF17003.1 hypothetical protein NGTWS1803_33970 [Mycolicibacterium sp. NGTWS1803]